MHTCPWTRLVCNLAQRTSVSRARASNVLRVCVCSLGARAQATRARTRAVRTHTHTHCGALSDTGTSRTCGLLRKKCAPNSAVFFVKICCVLFKNLLCSRWPYGTARRRIVRTYSARVQCVVQRTRRVPVQSTQRFRPEAGRWQVCRKFAIRNPLEICR